MKQLARAFIALTLVSTHADAALISREAGDVAVNSGSKYVPVEKTTTISAGDLVRTGKTVAP